MMLLMMQWCWHPTDWNGEYCDKGAPDATGHYVTASACPQRKLLTCTNDYTKVYNLSSSRYALSNFVQYYCNFFLNFETEISSRLFARTVLCLSDTADVCCRCWTCRTWQRTSLSSWKRYDTPNNCYMLSRGRIVCWPCACLSTEIASVVSKLCAVGTRQLRSPHELCPRCANTQWSSRSWSDAHDQQRNQRCFHRQRQDISWSLFNSYLIFKLKYFALYRVCVLHT